MTIFEPLSLLWILGHIFGVQSAQAATPSTTPAAPPASPQATPQAVKPPAAALPAGSPAVPKPWPAAVPPNLPKYPTGWEPYVPPPAPVVARANALLKTLSKPGQTTVEQTGNVWVTYVAFTPSPGKRGVAAYRLTAAAEQQLREDSLTPHEAIQKGPKLLTAAPAPKRGLVTQRKAAKRK